MEASWSPSAGVSDLLPRNATEWVVGNWLYNEEDRTKVKLVGFTRLKRIVIGDYSFGKVREFEIDGLNELESITIGMDNFKLGSGYRVDGVYRNKNCLKLKSIRIGARSFNDYYTFDLVNLPSLQSIVIGANCFDYASLFSLNGLLNWTPLMNRTSKSEINIYVSCVLSLSVCSL